MLLQIQWSPIIYKIVTFLNLLKIINLGLYRIKSYRIRFTSNRILSKFIVSNCIVSNSGQEVGHRCLRNFSSLCEPLMVRQITPFAGHCQKIYYQ